jgi:poly(A) polymerase
VRDLLLGRTPADLDFVTAAPPDAIRALFTHTLDVGAAFGVIAVVIDGHAYQVATFRREGPYLDGRRPTSVEPADAATDARRRDFTVNGLLYDPDADRVIDFVGGLGDLEQRLIRAVGDPDTRFGEDHLRALRAIRLAAELRFEIEPKTGAAIARSAMQLARISAERVREELWRLVVAEGRAAGIRIAAGTGVLHTILPEVTADVLARVERRLAAARRPSPTLAMALVLLDAGPLQARAVCRRLRCSGVETRIIAELVAAASEAAAIPRMTPGALRALGERVPPAELIEACRADAVARDGEVEAAHAAAVAIASAGVGVRLPALLSGDDLADLGYRPGPVFARILAEVEAARDRREIAGPEEARAWVLARFGRSGDGAGSSDGLMET